MYIISSILLCVVYFDSMNGFNVVESEIVYTFSSLDYDWPSSAARAKAIAKKEFIIENNIITGLKVYDNNVFVTVPRWRSGVPATLSKVISNGDNSSSPILQPYPSWDMNLIGICAAFQYVQSMEVDPNTGYMWVIDTGRVNTNAAPEPPQNLCPPKIVILNILTGDIVRKYFFPPDVASPTSNFMNDIVLDYVNGVAKFAYISDTNDAKIYVYDYDNDASYFYEDDSMKKQPLVPGKQDGLVSAPVDGIAMSADFKYLYYCTLSSLALYAVPTITMRRNSSNFSNALIKIGNKHGGSDGMTYGQSFLYFASLEDNAVYKASVGNNGRISVATETIVIKNDETVVWVDTFAWNGTDLWFTANKLTTYFSGHMNFNGSEDNMFIWKVNVGENGYLEGAEMRSLISKAIFLNPYCSILLSVLIMLCCKFS